MAYTKNVRNALSEKRVSRGIIVAERIRWAPLPMATRSRLLSSLVLPAALYGSSVGGIGHGPMNALTSAVMRAIWGTTRKLRCRDVVLTLLAPGHLVDPRQACTYQSLCALRRHMQKSPELVEIMRRCWRACVVDGMNAPGPVGLIYKHVIKIG